MKFTDALDAYLEAKKEYDEARKGFTGYDFSYFYYREEKRFRDAKTVLNDLFELGEQA
jgi:hypothetical protein